MNLTRMIAFGAFCVTLAAGTVFAAGKVKFLKPPPPGVVEIAGGAISLDWSLVERAHGELLMAAGKYYRLSKDGGSTWSKPEEWSCPVNVATLLRLKSGTLAAFGYRGKNIGGFEGQISLSLDDGKTWSPAYPVPLVAGTNSMPNELIQLSSGRLLLPAPVNFFCTHPDLMPEKDETPGAWGTWRGLRYMTESEGHVPMALVTVVYYSDDEGKTWHSFRRDKVLMGWFDEQGVPNGKQGVSYCDEPYAAETANGEVLLFARSQMGRIVYGRSRNQGEDWTAIRPTALASSNSPAFLKRIPKTGDLLCVWNQVSREEIRRGYRRGRLTAAVSKDGGKTWENFKTLELSEGLQDVARIPPEFPLAEVKARKDVGLLPDGWAYFHYANVDIVGDKVFLRYLRGSPSLGIADRNLDKQEVVMRVYPLEWFYKQE